jgi:YesN/AraC family two-component response regulator
MITDLRMEPKDGLELIQQIRASTRADLPIVVVSGESEVSEAVKAMHLGVVDFLVKPLDGDKLQALLGLVKRELKLDQP